MTVEQALSLKRILCGTVNVGRDAMLVALNKLGGFNIDRTLQMVISMLHEAMEHQDNAGCFTGPEVEQSSTTADICVTCAQQLTLQI